MQTRVFLLVAVVLGWMSLLGSSLLAQRPPVLGDPAEEAASMRKEFEQRRSKVTQAVDDAERSGKLEPATLTYFRESIAQFEKADPFRVELEKLHFPAKANGSPALGPLHLAWVELKKHIESAQDRVTHFHVSYRNRAAKLLREAARRGKSAEDLKPVEDLVTAWKAVPDLRPDSGTLWTAREATERAIVAVRAMLEAIKEDDARLLEEALRKVQFDGVAEIERSRLGGVPHREEPLVKEFAPRILEPRKQKVARLQAELEQKMIAAAPVGELEAEIVEFAREAGALDSLRQAADHRVGFEGNSSELVTGYRAMFRIAHALKGEPQPEHAALKMPEFTGFPRGAMVPSAALRTRLAELQIQWSAHLQKVHARKKAEEQAQTMALQAAYDKEQRAAFAEVAQGVRTKLLAIKKPEEALALAEQLPERWPGDKTMTWELIRRELRATARWWMDGVLPDLLFRARSEPAHESNHPFVAEMRTLRNLAFREVVEKRLEIAEIQEARFVDMDPVDALLKLADEGAKKGEWKRVYAYLQALEPLDFAGKFREVRTRRDAVRTFLTAENLEKAEQYAGAARGYLTVIGTVGEGLPTKEATERLKALQKEHPEAAKVRAFPATGFSLEVDGEARGPVEFEK